MFSIAPIGASEEFTKCWISAVKHLDNQTDNKIIWLREHLSPPLIEHLSFRLGNQIFFVQLYDIDGVLKTPNNNIKGLISFAREANAIPCLLPMKKVHRVTKTTGKIIRQGKNFSIEEAAPDDPIYTQGFRIGAENLTTHGWQPQGQSWCLLEPITNLSISPDKLVTTEKIEMSDWEVQDCAVTQVKNTLEKDGKKIMSWQSDPNLNPSIWFYDDTGTQYVVVCSGRHPQAEASLPENIESIKEECQTYGTRYDKKTISKGHFVSVIIADAHDPFDPLAKTNGNFLPLIRGILLNLEISEMESL